MLKKEIDMEQVYLLVLWSTYHISFYQLSWESMFGWLG